SCLCLFGRIYERVIDPPQMDLTAGSGIWLGQHSHRHGLFKLQIAPFSLILTSESQGMAIVIVALKPEYIIPLILEGCGGTMQDVKLVFAPNGYIMQCPNLNRTCPTCSDFLSLVQGIMDLQELLAKMTLKLNYAESRLSQLEGCHCERTCSVNDVVYRDKELWTEPENCRTCSCVNGVVECRRIFCPPANCSEDFLPVHVEGTCCRKCRPKCTYLDRTLSEGQRVLVQGCKECKNGLMLPVTESCPILNCTVKEQVLPENRCCNVCRGHDFCAEGMLCGENSVCKNRNNKAECECKSGYASIHGDSTYCEGPPQDPHRAGMMWVVDHSQHCSDTDVVVSFISAHRTLPTGLCPQDSAHRTLPTGRCPQDAAHRTLPTGRCPQDSAHSIVLIGG
ncbi:hypothetical protein NFI96_019954, partial [Prochilodus magdalenae]